MGYQGTVVVIIRVATLVGIIAAYASAALGQNSPPPFAIVEPKDTVEMEHQDRMQRLSKLSIYEGIQPPEFHEYRIPPDQHLLKGFPVSIPVLRVVFRDTVFFDFDKADLKPDAAGILNTIARSLQLEPPDVTAFVAGHTDAIGSAEYNLQLGFRRAKAVATALAQIGVNRSQIFMISFGKAVPVDTNDTDAGRAHNRRVEFLFAARPEPIAAWLAQQPFLTCGADKSAHGNNCPVDYKFTAVSVTTITKPTNLSLPSVAKSVDLPNHVRTVPVTSQTSNIVLGTKTVNIDLTHKIFTIQAPE